jgi:hypothetical protein
LVLYMGHISLTYLIMLIVMTYQAQLFIATILGLTCGHVIFNQSDYDLLCSRFWFCSRVSGCCCRWRRGARGGDPGSGNNGLGGALAAGSGGGTGGYGSINGSGGGSYGSTRLSAPLLSVDQKRQAL